VTQQTGPLRLTAYIFKALHQRARFFANVNAVLSCRTHLLTVFLDRPVCSITCDCSFWIHLPQPSSFWKTKSFYTVDAALFQLVWAMPFGVSHFGYLGERELLLNFNFNFNDIRFTCAHS